MGEEPNLVFIWTDQQSANTLPQYGNEVIDTPHLNDLADRSTVFEHPYVTTPLCGPSRSSIMTGMYPHSTGVIHNNVPLPEGLPILPEIGDFDDYTKAWMGKWHLGNEVYRQRGFDEWVSIEDCYHPYYDVGDSVEHSDYHHYLVHNDYSPDRRGDDGFEWFSRDWVANNVPEKHSKPKFLADKAIEFVERNQNEPFILYLMFLEPHPPYSGPRNDQYDPEEVPLPENFQHDGFQSQPDFVKFVREFIRHPDANISSMNEIVGQPPTKEGWKRLISRYWGLVSLVDTHIGRVLDSLNENDLDQATVTVFTSDHGDMMGSHQLISKMRQFEESVKVPLFIRVPGTERAGESVERPVSQIDLVPTVLDALGQTIPGRLQGRSLLPVLEGRELPSENVIIEWNGATQIGTNTISHYNTPSNIPQPTELGERIWNEMKFDRGIMEAASDPVRSIITPERLKLNYRRSGQHELYELTDDPHEMENRVTEAEYQTTVQRLYSQLIDWQLETRDPVSIAGGFEAS
jgi:arylsulfatase A-like enzyme